eukprot:GFUD01001611.1.p1 GENE.GFUD01001611.1~~GFUD01001611.1.p1  ORF type:complete len:407 (+),score=101.73 GFUD01001611.1:160-1380(+)
MEKASKALRRSGVRIRSIGSGHSDLQMVIAQLKDVRTAAKAFSTAQSSAMQDLVKWSLKDENRAIQDALTQVGELFSIWTEVQRDFSEHIKEFKHQFDMILEGAKQLDLAKADLQTAEIKEGKLKKELKKAAKKATTEELREMSVKLGEAEREKDLAQLEVVDRVREHEAVKMIRIKEGLFKISEAYIDYAQKCDVIFGAQRDIALQIPDVQDKDIQDIKYTGAGSTMQSVARAKDKIKRFRRRNSSLSRERSVVDDLPPPYSENPPVNPFYNDLVHNVNTSYNSDADNSRHSLDRSTLDDSRPLVVSPPCHGQPDPHRFSPLYSSNPLYPVLPNIPPYSSGVSGGPPAPADHQLWREYQIPDTDTLDPPPFSIVTRRDPFLRRDSYFSDNEDAAEMMGNLNLQPQ